LFLLSFVCLSCLFSLSFVRDFLGGVWGVICLMEMLAEKNLFKDKNEINFKV